MEKKIKIAGITQGYEHEPLALAYARMKPHFSNLSMGNDAVSLSRFTKKIAQVTQYLQYPSVNSTTFELLAPIYALGERFDAYKVGNVNKIENRV
ncbi:hypothetical protein [Myroides sp. DW712]|uniref:hypothetical protein n=1 Tax=Myroides sp. DW712 TaxID=3389800 RepID=UPI0039796163